MPRAAVVHLNFRSGSTFPVPFCTVPHGNWVNNQQDQPVQQMLTRSYMLNLLLLKGQRCVMHVLFIIVSQRCMVNKFTLPAALSLTFPPFYHVARCPLPYLPSILSRPPPGPLAAQLALILGLKPSISCSKAQTFYLLGFDQNMNLFFETDYIFFKGK